MKRGTILLLCALVLLGASARVAQASSLEQPVEFSIVGYATGVDTFQLDGCRLTLKGLTAVGSAQGDLSGVFFYRENGQVNVCVRYGINWGLMTIVSDSGAAHIWFIGDTDLVNVEGRWKLLGGTGKYAGLGGGGSYSGDAGFGPFTVRFIGSLSGG